MVCAMFRKEQSLFACQILSSLGIIYITTDRVRSNLHPKGSLLPVELRPTIEWSISEEYRTKVDMIVLTGIYGRP